MDPLRDAFLFVAAAYTIREMRAMAERQAEIDRQSAILDSVLTGMRDGVLVVGPQGEVLRANPAVESILGVRAHEAPLADWSRRLGCADHGCASRPTESLPLIRALRGESVCGEQYEVEHCVTSETVWLEVGAEPLQGVGGERIGGVAVFRDVTERRRILAETELARDEARRANRAKSELLSRTSHELRTPLNAILIFAQTLGMEELGAEARGDLAEIERAGKRLLGLVNEVLDLASLDARRGMLADSMEAVSPGEILTRIADGLRTEMDAEGVRMKVDEEDDALRIWADREALEKALRNVVANAVQYNRPKGEIRVRVERSGDGMVALSVTDEGAGMAPEGVARLFTPFDRLGAESTGAGGAGLGLAIAQGLTEAMGGKIRVRSEVGLGTTVALLLPAAMPMAVAA